MLSLTYSPPIFIRRLEPIKVSGSKRSVVVCAAKGPRPRYPRVWKTKNRIGTVSKSAKFVDCIMKLSNVKEEVYGALDAFVAWDLEFPLITVKKALKTLEEQREWKRIIQVTKWMLSKGQGRTMGSYFTLLNALAEDGRLDEAEQLWTKLFMQNLASTPRVFYDKMISIYYKRGMHEKMFEIFADMEELGVKPNVGIVSMVGNVFKELGMMDKYNKLNKKYPPPKWEYRYIKGKRVKVRSKHPEEPDGSDGSDGHASKQEKTKQTSNTIDEEGQTSSDELDMEAACSSKDVIEHEESGHSSNEFHEEAETSSNEVHIEANYSSKDVSMPEETARTSNEFHEEAETSSDEVKIEADVPS